MHYIVHLHQVQSVLCVFSSNVTSMPDVYVLFSHKLYLVNRQPKASETLLSGATKTSPGTCSSPCKASFLSSSPRKSGPLIQNRPTKSSTFRGLVHEFAGFTSSDTHNQPNNLPFFSSFDGWISVMRTPSYSRNFSHSFWEIPKHSWEVNQVIDSTKL